MSRRRALSPHFQAREFYCRDGTRWPLSVRQQLVHLCREYLEPLRRAHGPVTIVSGYRHRTYNERVGGVRDSRHIYLDRRGRGVAVDLRCAEGSPADWYRTLDELGIGGLGIYDDYVHADTRDGSARWDETAAGPI